MTCRPTSPPRGVLAPATRSRPHLAGTLMALAVAAVLGTELVLGGPSLLTAVRGLTRVPAGWVVVATAAAAASMVAFGLLRARTLRAAGVRVPLGRAVAVSYAAGAVHVTMPAGTVFSTTYAFRQIRDWGASPSAATWSLTITGLLSTATLGVVGLLGLAASGGTGGSATTEIGELAGLGALIAAIVMLTRHPALLVRTARGALLLLNRARRRPAETGVARLAGLTQDLRSIRPTPRAWAESVGLALLNWLLDIGALAACCAAFDLHVSLSVLLLTYTAGMAAAGLTPLPAGVGAVETAMTLGLTLGGATASAALGVVLLYRLISVGSTVAVGWIVVALQPHHHHTGVEPIGSQH